MLSFLTRSTCIPLIGNRRRLGTALPLQTQKSIKTNLPSVANAPVSDRPTSPSLIPTGPATASTPSPPAAPPQSTAASGRTSPIRPADDGFTIDFPEYNQENQVVVDVKRVSGATKKGKLEENYAAIKDRVSLLEKNVNKRIDRLQGSINYMSKCVEDFNENFGTIMELIREKRVRDTAETLPPDTTFPLSSKKRVNKYLEKDPQCIEMIDR